MNAAHLMAGGLVCCELRTAKSGTGLPDALQAWRNGIQTDALALARSFEKQLSTGLRMPI